jgi:hypothetical protein
MMRPARGGARMDRKIPATIDDPAILGEMADGLKAAGLG